MIAIPSSPRLGLAADRSDRPPFLGSYRALAACTRQFGKLVEDIARGASRIPSGEPLAGEPLARAVVRQSPGRCIVQFGPVALTVTWLRSTLDIVSHGELLVAVWQGAVAPPMRGLPERAAQARSGDAATLLWEQVYAVEAESEASWNWCPLESEGGHSSTDLAEQCVDRLRLAYLDQESAAHA